ncbi:hypothetical protein Tco_1239741 [Tanacetum coccineum]
MSSPNRSTSDIEDAFSSMNILNYTSVSPDYFPASSGSRSFNSSKNFTDNMTPPIFSSCYNNTYLKDVQAFLSPISSLAPITHNYFDSISILPTSLLFDLDISFFLKKLLHLKKRNRSSSSSSTSLSKLHPRNQLYLDAPQKDVNIRKTQSINLDAIRTLGVKRETTKSFQYCILSALMRCLIGGLLMPIFGTEQANRTTGLIKKAYDE